MGEITVSVIRGGRLIEKITRPQRSLNGAPAVTYRHALRPVQNGCIYLDGAPSGEEDQTPPADASAKDNQTCEPEEIAEAALAYPESADWDQSQRDVINAAPDARILVDAGPGTGKTAVACARIAHLIQEDVNPVNCLVISFTRTAVHEIRNRIASYLESPATAAAITIATIDSHAWALHSGFASEAKLTGSYDENIEAAIERLTSDEQLSDFLSQLEHLIVDEAQDVVGIRSDFVETLIGKLPAACGITIFADHAQSIYGFTEEDVPAEEARAPLVERIGARADFKHASLTEVHRTKSEKLTRIFTEVRKLVLDKSDSSSSKREAVADAIVALAEKSGLKARELKIGDLPDSALVLFRRRAEALMASSLFGVAPHRLRLSGLPVALHPWIGACFFDWCQRRIAEDQFLALWEARVIGPLASGVSASAAWQSLVEIAGIRQQLVDMELLRRRLGRQQPPAQFCSADLGLNGPVVGTIHASKGREANAVFLMMPGDAGTNVDNDDGDAETRVIFVGATRARSHLYVGAGFTLFPRRTASGRAWRSPNGKSERTLIIEFGRSGDILPEGLTGRRHFATAELASKTQQMCLSLVNSPIGGAMAISSAAPDYVYRIYSPETESYIACFSKRVNDDLWELSNEAAAKMGQNRAKPPDKIPHLRLLGARTVVLPPNTAELETLHEPWSSSGIMLAPIVLGFSKVWFRPYVRRN